MGTLAALRSKPAAPSVSSFATSARTAPVLVEAIADTARTVRLLLWPTPLTSTDAAHNLPVKTGTRQIRRSSTSRQSASADMGFRAVPVISCPFPIPPWRPETGLRRRIQKVHGRFRPHSTNRRYLQRPQWIPRKVQKVHPYRE